MGLLDGIQFCHFLGAFLQFTCFSGGGNFLGHACHLSFSLSRDESLLQLLLLYKYIASLFC